MTSGGNGPWCRWLSAAHSDSLPLQTMGLPAGPPLWREGSGGGFIATFLSIPVLYSSCPTMMPVHHEWIRTFYGHVCSPCFSHKIIKWGAYAHAPSLTPELRQNVSFLGTPRDRSLKSLREVACCTICVPGGEASGSIWRAHSTQLSHTELCSLFWCLSSRNSWNDYKYFSFQIPTYKHIYTHTNPLANSQILTWH